MPLCFIEPQDAIRVIAESVGREARRQLLGELVRAWVDEIPESELEAHYAKAVADLDEHDLSMLAAWHASLEVGQPIANREFLVNVFSSLGDNRREALKIAAGFRGEEAFDAGVAEEQALDTVLPLPLARALDASSPASASSSTSGTGWAPTTEPAAGRASASRALGHRAVRRGRSAVSRRRRYQRRPTLSADGIRGAIPRQDAEGVAKAREVRRLRAAAAGRRPRSARRHSLSLDAAARAQRCARPRMQRYARRSTS